MAVCVAVPLWPWVCARARAVYAPVRVLGSVTVLLSVPRSGVASAPQSASESADAWGGVWGQALAEMSGGPTAWRWGSVWERVLDCAWD